MSDVATATIDTTPRDAVSIAAAAGERAAELRHGRMVADLERWAAIVNGIAAGGEASGELLQEVAELADRLRLPAGALAEDTAAVVAVRKLTDRLDTARAALEQNMMDVPAKRAALDAARRRVRDLEVELANGATLPAGIASEGIGAGRAAGSASPALRRRCRPRAAHARCIPGGRVEAVLTDGGDPMIETANVRGRGPGALRVQLRNAPRWWRQLLDQGRVRGGLVRLWPEDKPSAADVAATVARLRRLAGLE